MPPPPVLYVSLFLYTCACLFFNIPSSLIFFFFFFSSLFHMCALFFYRWSSDEKERGWQTLIFISVVRRESFAPAFNIRRGCDDVIFTHRERELFHPDAISPTHSRRRAHITFLLLPSYNVAFSARIPFLLLSQLYRRNSMRSPFHGPNLDGYAFVFCEFNRE